MWDYSDKVIDHFKNPRNVGTIANPDGIGEVGALACGDALKLMFKLDEAGKIVDVKFQTFGCASAIASSSALTEMIKGMTLEEASKVTNQDIANFLGGLPEQKMHCSVMGMEALEAAIHNYRTGDTTVRELKDDPVICTCFNVHESDIAEAVRINHLTTVEQVTDYTKAGGACGKCKGAIAALLEKLNGPVEGAASCSVAETAKTEEAPVLTPFKKMKLIEEVIERDVRPMLRRDGGDLEIIDVQGDKVLIAFKGHCAGCIAAAFTKNGLVQKALRDAISKDLTVEVVE